MESVGSPRLQHGLGDPICFSLVFSMWIVDDEFRLDFQRPDIKLVFVTLAGYTAARATAALSLDECSSCTISRPREQSGKTLER